MKVVAKNNEGNSAKIVFNGKHLDPGSASGMTSFCRLIGIIRKYRSVWKFFPDSVLLDVIQEVGSASGMTSDFAYQKCYSMQASSRCFFPDSVYS